MQGRCQLYARGEGNAVMRQSGHSSPLCRNLHRKPSKQSKPPLTSKTSLQRKVPVLPRYVQSFFFEVSLAQMLHSPRRKRMLSSAENVDRTKRDITRCRLEVQMNL